jgi:hypothetical protein
MFEKLNQDITLGCFVHTKKHNLSGRVIGFQFGSPQYPEWLDIQEPPLTDEERDELVLVNILVNSGGAIIVPDSDCELIEPIEGFTHLDNKFYFGAEDAYNVKS